jgi:uncharacterized protein YjbI with pentapeptide repeats
MCDYSVKLRDHRIIGEIEYICPHPPLSKKPGKNGRRLCIFHSDEENKDIMKFYLGFKELYEKKEHRFVGFIFPKGFLFKHLSKELGLSGLKFVDADFSHAIFLDFADLGFSKFKGDITSFHRTHFCGQGGANFVLAEFRSGKVTDFDDALFFGDTAFFGNTKFIGDGYKTFNGTQFSPGNNVSFNSTVFSGKGDVRFSSTFFCDVDFSEAEFSNEGFVSFKDSTFQNCKVNFSRAAFSGTGDVNFIGINSFKGIHTKLTSITFEEAEFSNGGGLYFIDSYLDCEKDETISFRDTKFASKKGVLFLETVFSGGLVDFKNAQFVGGGSIKFSGKTFSNARTDFIDATFTNPNEVAFDNVDLNHVRFLWTDVRDFKFQEVFWTNMQYEKKDIQERNPLLDRLETYKSCVMDIFDKDLEDLYEIVINYKKLFQRITAAYKKLLTLLTAEDRVKVFDETFQVKYWWETKERQLYNVQAIYNQLQLNYEATGRYHEAGEFFVGAMEMRRRGKREKWFIRKGLFFYKWFSLYGERPVRVLIWLVFLALLFGFLNLVVGIQPIKASIEISVINRNVFSLKALGDLGFWYDYMQAIIASLWPISFNKIETAYVVGNSSIGMVLKISETITGYFFISLFILAMNRKFRRTKD